MSKTAREEVKFLSAAVANYPGPSDEELRVAAIALPIGSRMVEVFSVRAIDKKEKLPSGIIALCDYTSASSIYSGDEPSNRTFHNQDNFVLTGPKHPISAYNASFWFDLHDESKHSSAADACRKEVSWQVDFEQVENDKPLNRTFETCYGHVEATFVVLRSAIGAMLQVKFLSQVEEDCTKICGKIVARSIQFKIGSVLFNKEHDDNILMNSQELIPLSRYVVAVPLVWPLIIDVDLCTPFGDEVVKCAVAFFPEILGSHTKNFIGEKYGVEVEITWQR